MEAGELLINQYRCISPVDFRYSDETSRDAFCEETYIRHLCGVEASAAWGLAHFKACNPYDARLIARACTKVRARPVYIEERETKHDIDALRNCICSHLPDKVRHLVHLGLTSYDVIDTARIVMYKEAVRSLILPLLLELEKVLFALALRYVDTKQMGRTHGQHAVPVTFGFAIALFVSRLAGAVLELRRKRSELRGKICGGVGASNALSVLPLQPKDPLAYESYVLQRLGVHPADISSQIVPPEPLLRLLSEMVLVGGIIADLARSMRHLMRTEIAEVGEEFSADQTGSSTMPHKRNPIVFENAESLHYVLTALGVLPDLIQKSEHQRDLTNSAAARFLPEIPAILVYQARRMAGTMARMRVDEDSLKRNLGLLGDVWLSEPLYVCFALAGHQEAHKAAKGLATKARTTGKSLRQVLAEDEVLSSLIENNLDDELKRMLTMLFTDPPSYIGMAERRTMAVLECWSDRLHVPWDEIEALSRVA